MILALVGVERNIKIVVADTNNGFQILYHF